MKSSFIYSSIYLLREVCNTTKMDEFMTGVKQTKDIYA